MVINLWNACKQPCIILLVICRNQYLPTDSADEAFFLNLVGVSVTVLFVSSRQPIRSFSDIRQNSILGAILGKKVMRIFLERFPRLSRIFDFRKFNDNVRFDDFFRSGIFSGEGFEHFCRNMAEIMPDLGTNRSEYLSKRDIENWFRGDLSRHMIEVAISDTDIKEIRQAISKDDEFILVFNDNRLHSVVSVCFLIRDMSRKVLDNIVEKK
ncbi:hypothetical protein [uncultured Candidatus Kuenenia sp.]|uniref:hypothetical protein n=1 Tax=uncultured Candidatus Kuenenia sp. TaxID=1048336 RepID=UPI0025F15852|nr:hypothetical protein [uncultured Candidatus Kuenenia sp.]